MLTNFFKMLFRQQDHFINPALSSESASKMNFLTPDECETMRLQDPQFLEKPHLNAHLNVNQHLRTSKIAQQVTNRNYYVATNGAVLLNNTVLYTNLTIDQSEELAHYANLFHKEIGRHPEDWEELKEFMFNVQNLLC